MPKVTVIAVGQKMPSWVNLATIEFSKRLNDVIELQLIEVPLLKRGKTHDLSRILAKETALIEALIPPMCRLIALDQKGETFKSEQLAERIERLQHLANHWCFLIGGPEGLSDDLRAKCHERWSLSALTFPHTIARIVLLEALYRAFAILNHHPYHK